jgi:uncharacterized membrane protein YhaH (DUF805 family)
LLKRIWNDPVWSKVIAGGILTILALIASYFLNLWHYIADFLKPATGLFVYLWELKSSTTAVTNWLLAVIVIFALCTLFNVIGLAVNRVRSAEKPEITWQSYREDLFYNIRWRWGYVNNRLADLRSYCANCDYQIFPKRSDRFDDNIHYDCESCNSLLQTFDEPYPQIESKIARFIEQKIRNEKWREIVSSLPQKSN